MKTIALLAAVLSLTACQRAPDEQQPRAVAQRRVAETDPVVARVMRDFPKDRFVYVDTPSTRGIIVDRRSGCIYDVNYERMEPILAADRRPDCSYADKSAAPGQATPAPRVRAPAGSANY
jgi:hypothetical protein